VVDVNLMEGAQREASILFESLAIIEYLDETHPNPPLTPGVARVCGGSHKSSPAIHTR